MGITTQKKGKPVRLYVYEEDEPLLNSLIEATGLSGTMIMSVIVSSGLRACAGAGNRMTLPLKFVIAEVESAPQNRLTRPPTIHK